MCIKTKNDIARRNRCETGDKKERDDKKHSMEYAPVLSTSKAVKWVRRVSQFPSPIGLSFFLNYKPPVTVVVESKQAERWSLQVSQLRPCILISKSPVPVQYLLVQTAYNYLVSRSFSDIEFSGTPRFAFRRDDVINYLLYYTVQNLCRSEYWFDLGHAPSI